jgi:hypothetical protein
VETYLVNWFDEHLRRSIEKGDYVLSTGVYPGDYKLTKVDFEWSLLKLDDERAAIRFVTDVYSIDEISFNDIEFISFSDRSRFSVLVKKHSSSTFGDISEDFLIPAGVSGRVSVLCMKNEIVRSEILGQ